MLGLLSRLWWLVLIRGLLAIVFGILALTWPGITLVTLVILFGAYIFADGVFALAHAIRGGDARESAWVLALEGLLGIGVGLITFFAPTMTAVVLLFYIAAWALVTGVLEVIAAIRLRSEMTGEIWMMLGGLLSIAFAVFLMTSPVAGAVALVWAIGLYALFFGGLLVALGFRLRAASVRAHAALA